ncbi:AT-hook motif nuclear-localized protein 1 [Actinidia rufa]|uniref:AT-hook motif nuclear-localized protein n=1 Tax=Actinidia rufa TaxID=165716 RepID=A0A7J0E898_9ERIC|nr:AT-hook motif nuclear-localized protein 1 [Actinidia rufa]
MEEKEILTSGSPARFSKTGSPPLPLSSVGVGGEMVPQVMGMAVNMSLGGTSGGGGNGSGGDVTGKKKRGRPRKYDSDGELFADTAGWDFTPHVVTVNTGEDVAQKILSFSMKGPRGICVLSANGAVSNVTIHQPGSSGGLLTYEGRFEILSLTGSFTVSENGGVRSRTGRLSVSLAGPDGRVVGGGIAGLLTAASPIQKLSEEVPKEPKEEMLPPSSMVNNGGMNELSHELILLCLWPINRDGCGRKKKRARQCREILAKFESPECHRSKLSNSEQIRSAQNRRLSIPRDSSLRYEAPAPNGFQIGVQTSPHAPFEVRRVRSTRPMRARGRRRLEFTRPHAPSRACTRQESGCHSQHAPARARTRQASGGNTQARAPSAQPLPASRAQLSAQTALASASVMTDSDNDAFLVSSADENPDWVLDSGSTYHFCRDRKMFSTYAACEGLVRMANNTTNKVVGKGTARFRMTDGSIAAKGGILRISKGNKEMLRGRKIRGLYRLEGNVQTGRDAVRHGSSDIRRKNGQGKQQVHTGTQSKCRDTWRSQSGTRAQGDALRHVRKSDQKRPVQPVQDVHRKVQRKETKSILKSWGARHLSEKVQALQSGSALPIDEGKIVVGSFMPNGFKAHKRKHQYEPITSPNTVTAATPISQAPPHGNISLTPTSQLPSQNHGEADKQNPNAISTDSVEWNSSELTLAQRPSPDINLSVPLDWS